MGLQASWDGEKGGGASIKASLVVVATFSLFFGIFLGGMLVSRFVIDLGDSKGEGSFLGLDLEEAAVEDFFFLDMSSDWEYGLEGFEDAGLREGLDRDLGDSGGLGVTSSVGLGDNNGDITPSDGALGAGIFLDVSQEELKKPECRRGRLFCIPPNSSAELPWKTRAEAAQIMQSKVWTTAQPSADQLHYSIDRNW